jgi:glycosyltransferase involved in cell wall biosynthesis
MKTKVFYVTDSLDWVQAKRLPLFQKYLPEFEFVPVIFKDLFRVQKWFSLKRANVYFTNWRGLTLYRSYLKRLNPEKCIVSITSHYNLGGGLNDKYALPAGVSAKTAITRALEVLKLFPNITVNSKILHDFLKQWLKTTILENGVDHRLFVKKQRHPFNPNSIAVGWIGKVKAAKNYEETIKPAFKELARFGYRIYDYPLPKKGYSKYLKNSMEMVEYYNLLDFYICASWHEGTPNPALEAASCGVPVITTRVGNMPELIKEGVNGGFIEPNRSSLVEKLLSYRNLSEEAYRRMSQNSRMIIEQKWTWEIKFQKFRDYFRKVYLV